MEKAYDVYLDPDFDPIRFANTLVTSTTASTDKEVDLDVPQRKVGYDSAEVDQIVLDVAKEHHKELLACATFSSKIKTQISPIKSELDHVMVSYNRLLRDVVRPYNRAQDLYVELKRLHATTNLLNNLVWYLHLARQLNALCAQSASDPESLYRASMALEEIHSQIRAHPILCSLQIVRAHSASLSNTREQLLGRAHHYLNNLSLTGPDSTLRYALLTLGHDSEKSTLPNATQAYCQSQASSAIAQFSKALPRGMQAVLATTQDTRNRARCIALLQKTLESYNLSSHLEGSHQNVMSEFWRNVASGLNSSIKEQLVRAPQMIRSLDYQKFKSALDNAVVEGGGGVLADGLEVRVLTGALSALQKR